MDNLFSDFPQSRVSRHAPFKMTQFLDDKHNKFLKKKSEAAEEERRMLLERALIAGISTKTDTKAL